MSTPETVNIFILHFNYHAVIPDDDCKIVETLDKNVVKSVM